MGKRVENKNGNLAVFESAVRSLKLEIVHKNPVLTSAYRNRNWVVMCAKNNSFN